MKENRFSWSEIRSSFRNQWVELVNFEWDWDTASPSWASVRHFAESRPDLISKISTSKPVEDSVILYIGASQFVVRREEAVAAI